MATPRFLAITTKQIIFPDNMFAGCLEQNTTKQKKIILTPEFLTWFSFEKPTFTGLLSKKKFH